MRIDHFLDSAVKQTASSLVVVTNCNFDLLSLFILSDTYFSSPQLEGVNVTKSRTRPHLYFTTPDRTFIALEAPRSRFVAGEVHRN